MNISEQIASLWAARYKEIEIVWLLLSRSGKEAASDESIAKLQKRITACLLMTPFAPESGQQVGEKLAQQFGFHLEKLGRLQLLLAEQLLAPLNEAQTAWLAPRLIAFWAEMTIGYGQSVDEFYMAKQAALQQKLMADFQQVTTQVAESEERFETLFENAYNPLFIHENGRILAINTAVSQLFGYSAKELVGKRVQALIQTLTPPAEQAKILKHLGNGQETPLQTRCLKKDGTAIIVEATDRYVTYQERIVCMVILRPLDESFVLLPEPDEVNLTPRQEAVLQQMAAGLADKEIAEVLDISLATVNHHKAEIFKKLQIETRAEAIVWVWRKLQPPDLSA